ncbi:MAG: hypothetical protein J5892_01240 [Bacilli bacterium]|nr:hypothetical protein [Bacilli bacterium]
MKKKIMIITIIVIGLIIGVIGFICWNNRTVTTITVDINPSIKINLKKDNKVKSVIALNDDAKDIISKDLKGKNLDDAFEIIVNNLIEKEYITTEELVDVIIYTEGNVTNEEINRKISKTMGDNNIATNIIMIDTITKEDKEIAKKYNVSLGKAAYINTIIDENSNIKIEVLTDKSVSDLKESKVTGNYCEDGYTLEGDWCLKEIRREAASSGMICPAGYNDHDGICYAEIDSKESDELSCPGGFTLKDNKCISTNDMEANPEYACSKGELVTDPVGLKRGIKTPVCVDKSTGKKPTLRCLLNPGHIMINGKCYNGPAPVINGGCPNGDTLRNGGCYSKDDEDQWQCPSGDIYEKSKGTYVELCPDTLTYITPTITGYTCPEGYTVKDKKCVHEDIVDPYHLRDCISGYTLTDSNRCVNYNKTVPKTEGLVCNNEDARVKNNMCVIYDVIEAKH